MMNNIVVHKLNESGIEVWRYEGKVLDFDLKQVTLEARFDREKVEFHGITLNKGDRFVETFYAEYWYNTFAIYDAHNDCFKGWYCNITRPARIELGHIYAEDLAIDLIVYPDGQWLVLDEDEFEELDIPKQDREQAKVALSDLIRHAENKTGPFRRINSSES